MKIKVKFVLIIFVLFSFLSAKTEIEVKTLVFPETPLYGTLKLELSPPLIIGSETDDRYFFSSLREIKVDKEGRIYALDNKTARIQVYNKNGEFAETIGRKGQGPGEFSIPYNFFMDEKGNIFVLDTMARKIIVFSDDWKYMKSIPFNEIVHSNFFVDKEGNVFFSTVASEPDGNMYINFIKWELKGNIKSKIVSDFFLKMIISSKGRFFYDHPYLQNFYFSRLIGDTVVLVKSLEPTIYYFSNEGEILYKVLKEEKTERINQKEKEIVFSESFEWLEEGRHDEVFFPEFRPVYSSLLVDDENRIYLERFKPINDKSTSYSYYVFNEKGRYLYNLVLNFQIEFIKDGYVYTIKIDEKSGETNLLRYNIKNWNQIKKESNSKMSKNQEAKLYLCQTEAKSPRAPASLN